MRARTHTHTHTHTQTHTHTHTHKHTVFTFFKAEKSDTNIFECLPLSLSIRVLEQRSYGLPRCNIRLDNGSGR